MHELPHFPVLSRIFRRIWPQLIILAVLTAGHVLLEFIPEVAKHPVIPKALAFFGVWNLTWMISKAVGVFREAPFVERKLSANLRPVVFAILSFLVYFLGFLIALDSLGVSITPLLASLGVGSLAVGLALQDTLGNLFSGFYLYVDRPIAIGDWIRLENATEGQVVSIGWRSTHLLVLQENVVVIPNSKLSSSMVVNFSLPADGMTFSIPIGVAYDADLDQVEKTLIESVSKVSTGMPGFFAADNSPVVRFTKFGASTIDLNLIVKVRSFPDQGLIRHSLIKQIKADFAQVGIEIPYPVSVVQHVNPASAAI